MVVSVAVAGASGRLGSLICEVITDLPGFELVARLTSASGSEEGVDADVLVDVTHPDVSADIVDRAIARGQKVIVGTSGWSEQKLARLTATAEATPGAGVIVVPNFSLGSVLGTALAQIAAPYYSSIEVVEVHHAAKVDSPSGTAVRTAELMAAARANAGAAQIEAPYAEQRARGELVAGIPVHSLRLTGVKAKQEVHFSGPGEVLSVVHDTVSNEAYVAGIRAALTAIPTATGVTVGLDRVLGISARGGAE